MINLAGLSSLVYFSLSLVVRNNVSIVVSSSSVSLSLCAEGGRPSWRAVTGGRESVRHERSNSTQTHTLSHNRSIERFGFVRVSRC